MFAVYKVGWRMGQTWAVRTSCVHFVHDGCRTRSEDTKHSVYQYPYMSRCTPYFARDCLFHHARNCTTGSLCSVQNHRLSPRKCSSESKFGVGMRIKSQNQCGRE
ncbi:unnamed protein product [Sphacelaria rigidula]